MGVKHRVLVDQVPVSNTLPFPKASVHLVPYASFLHTGEATQLVKARLKIKINNLYLNLKLIYIFNLNYINYLPFFLVALLFQKLPSNCVELWKENNHYNNYHTMETTTESGSAASRLDSEELSNFPHLTRVSRRYARHCRYIQCRA